VAWQRSWATRAGARPKSAVTWLSIPVVHRQCSSWRSKPGLANARTTAWPGRTSTGSSVATTLKRCEATPMRSTSASGEPRVRSIVEVPDVPSRRTVSSPAWRANSGSSVTTAPTRQSAMSSS
jgi:hypothetical protein